MPQPKIKVFWDLETCPPPTSSYTSPWEIVKDLRLFTSHFGVVTTIKAYWNSSQASDARNDAGADSFRAAIPSMGLTLVDCSLTKGYTQVAPTKMLAVDVLISAVDELMGSGEPAEDIIMILSGDDSVLYPISLLMFRNYTIFLVVPDEDNNVQPFQATRIFNWHRDVLGFELKEPTTIPDSIGASQPREFQNIGQGAPVPLRGTTTTTALPAHASLSRAIKSNTVPSTDSKSNVKPPPTSEHFDPHEPLVPDSRTSQSHTAATTHHGHASTKLKKASSDTWPQSLPNKVTPSPSDMSPNHGWETGGGGGGWEVGGGDWDTNDNDGWRTNNDPWAAPLAKKKITFGTEGPVEPGPSQPEIEEEQFEAPTDVPLSVFDPLLQILRESKRRSMGRSKLGEELAKKKSIYKAAGVKGFAEYIALAAAKDLVITGGIDNNQYVRLHPKLKNN